MMKKYYFNMIEIILAISVIAIGISSVMALFVSGIRTGTETVSSSNMPDVSESMLNFIRAKIESCRTSSGWDTGKLDKIAPEGTVAGAGDFASLLGESSDGAVVKGDDKGCFLYRQLAVTALDGSGKPSKYVPHFAAVASVKRRMEDSATFSDIRLSDPSDPKKVPFSKMSELKDADGNSGTTLMGKFRLVVQVTISYPADAPADLRNSKTYVMEFFNDQYDRFTGEKQDASTP